MMDTLIGKIDNVGCILQFAVHPGELGKFNNLKHLTLCFIIQQIKIKSHKFDFKTHCHPGG